MARSSHARFRVQHISRTPRGWHVRTKREGAHELRIAFPPGARRTGSGQLVEILHPIAERNPVCELAGKNPKEIATGRGKWHGYIAFPEGIKYTQAVQSRQEAFKAAAKILDEKPDWRASAKSYGAIKLIDESNPAELIIFGNPSTENAKNPTWMNVDGVIGKLIDVRGDTPGRIEYLLEKKDGTKVWVHPPNNLPPKKNSAGGAPNHRPGCDCPICQNMRAAAGRLPNVSIDYSDKSNSQLRNMLKRALRASLTLSHGGTSLSPSALVLADQADEIKAELKMRENEEDPPFGMSRMAARRARHKRNQGSQSERAEDMQQSVTLYQTFHGKDPSGVIERQVSAEIRLDYTALGDLDYLIVKPEGVVEVKIDFGGDGVKLASAPDGRQLYLIGGKQTLDEGCLAKFTDDTSKDLFDLGEAREVQYIAKKAPNFDTVRYYHKFGEERSGSEMPRAFYDGIRKQIFLAGGEYHIEAPGIIN